MGLNMMNHKMEYNMPEMINHLPNPPYTMLSTTLRNVLMSMIMCMAKDMITRDLFPLGSSLGLKCMSLNKGG